MSKPKTFSPRDEVKKARRAEAIPKIKRKAYKLGAGVIIVGFAFSGVFNFLTQQAKDSVSRIALEVVAGVVVVGLVTVLISCDQK